MVSVRGLSALCVKVLSTESANLRRCSIGHNAAGRAHGRDRLRQVDRGRAAAGRRARSWSTPTRSRGRWSSRASRRSRRWSSGSGPGSSTPTAVSTGRRWPRSPSPTTTAARPWATSPGPRSARSSSAGSRRRRPTPSSCATSRCSWRARTPPARPYVAVIVVEAPVEPPPRPARDPGRGPRRRRAADGGAGDRRGAARGGHARRRQRRRPGVAGAARSTIWRPPARPTSCRSTRSTGITVTPRR